MNRTERDKPAGTRKARNGDLTSAVSHRRKQDARRRDADVRDRGPDSGGGNLRPAKR